MTPVPPLNLRPGSNFSRLPLQSTIDLLHLVRAGSRLKNEVKQMCSRSHEFESIPRTRSGFGLPSTTFSLINLVRRKKSGSTRKIFNYSAVRNTRCIPRGYIIEAHRFICRGCARHCVHRQLCPAAEVRVDLGAYHSGRSLS